MPAPGRLTLVFRHRDPLATVVPARPVRDAPDLRALPVGVLEDGRPWTVQLAGSHLLVGGASGSGKGSVLWSLIRAVGFVVVAALQDPRKEVLPFRDVFPTRVALRLTEPEQSRIMLSPGAHERGAGCERIPVALPGVGYVVLDGLPDPVRVRAGWVTDDNIAVTAERYPARRGDVIDAAVVDEGTGVIAADLVPRPDDAEGAAA